MIDSAALLICNLDADLKHIQKTEENNIHAFKQSLKKIAACCDIFNQALATYNFQSREEEIFLFKELKPMLYSKLFYYNNLLKIEVKKPGINKEFQIKFYEKYLSKLDRYFDSIKQFYLYYKMRETRLDERYFNQNAQGELIYNKDGKILYCDNDFIGLNDLVLSEILGKEFTVKYLNGEIAKLRGENKNEVSPLEQSPYKWTDSKTAFVEAIYAFQAAGSINNGNEDTVKIIDFFAKALKVEIDDPYRIYCELKMRSNPTKYLDQLKSRLNKKMEDENEKQ